MRPVICINSVYGKICHKRIKGGRRQRIFTPLEKQPDPSDVIALHRAYAKHAQSPNYQRKISWNDDREAAIVEYIWRYPGRAFHEGRQHSREREYVVTKPTTTENRNKDVLEQTPTDVMQTRRDEEPEVGGLQSEEQVDNVGYRTERQQQQTQTYKGNLADHVLTIPNMTHGREFVRAVQTTKDKVPCIILYTDDQIEDVKRFCCSAPSARTTVLGVDKTFMLAGDLHVTLVVFKNLAVKRRDTHEHPTFAGPLFLHGNSDYQTYLSFFSHLAGKLRETTSQPIVGTCDEIAMRLAAKTAFPDSSPLSCTRQLEQNVEEHLRDEIGISHIDRCAIQSSIFGPVGVTAAVDEIIFNSRLDATTAVYTETAPAFDGYFKDRVAPLLRSNFATFISSQSTPPLTNWTNGSCENMNAILKQATDWQSQPLSDLVLRLYDAVRSQYQEVRRALTGKGDYALCRQFAKFGIPLQDWTTLTQPRRDKHYKKFREQAAKITSKTTDCTLTVASADGGKKSGQVKRKRASMSKSVAKRTRV